MMQKHYTVDNMLRVKVEAGNLLRGEQLVKDMVMAFSSHRSDESLLLRQRLFTTKIRMEKLVVWTGVYGALYISQKAEDIVKYRYAHPLSRSWVFCTS